MKNKSKQKTSVTIKEFEQLKKNSEILEDCREVLKYIENTAVEHHHTDKKAMYFVIGINLSDIITGKINIRAHKKLMEHCSKCEFKKQLQSSHAAS